MYLNHNSDILSLKTLFTFFYILDTYHIHLPHTLWCIPLNHIWHTALKNTLIFSTPIPLYSFIPPTIILFYFLFLILLKIYLNHILICPHTSSLYPLMYTSKPYFFYAVSRHHAIPPLTPWTYICRFSGRSALLIPTR